MLSRMTIAEPPVLRPTSAADFFATVPAITGFTARNSVVVLPFVGKRSRGAFRMDLPRSTRRSDLGAIGSWIVTTLGKLPEVTGVDVDGVAIVVYTDASFAEQNGIPHLEVWRAIASKLRRSGFALKEAGCIASDGWASYLDTQRPREGRPLSEITESRGALEAAFQVGIVPDASGWGELPPVDTELSRRVALAVNELLVHGDRTDSFGLVRAVAFDPVVLAERLVTAARSGTTIGAGALAELSVIAHTPALRDVLLIAMASGFEHGEVALQQQAEWFEPQAASGMSAKAFAAQRLDNRAPSDDDLFLVGRSRRRPVEERVIASIDVLRRAAAAAPRSHRAGTLCVLTWMLWSHGFLSAATRMHALAAECDPHLTMVETLGWLLDSGYPAWNLDDYAATSVHE